MKTPSHGTKIAPEIGNGSTDYVPKAEFHAMVETIFMRIGDTQEITNDRLERIENANNVQLSAVAMRLDKVAKNQSEVSTALTKLSKDVHDVEKSLINISRRMGTVEEERTSNSNIAERLAVVHVEKEETEVAAKKTDLELRRQRWETVSFVAKQAAKWLTAGTGGALLYAAAKHFLGVP